MAQVMAKTDYSPAIQEMAEAQQELRDVLARKVVVQTDETRARNRYRLAADAVRAEHRELMEQSWVI